MCLNPCLSKNTFGLQMEGLTVPPNSSPLTFNKAPQNRSLTPSPSSLDKTDNHETIEDLSPEHVPEDTTSDMRIEEERLKTFENWPITFLSPSVLARNGFYYLGRGDEVRCAFCKVEIMKWVERDDPASDHKRWAPQCPLVRRRCAEPAGRDECGVRAPSTTPRHMPGPVHKKYASQAARLSTFKDWPRSLRQKPEDLADAGFFYTGQGDKTTCFYCDGGLKDWEEDDIPWEQHARWFSRCAYVQLVKGKQFVQMVISEACFIDTNEAKSDTAVPQAVKPQEPVKEEKAIEDSKLCIICYSEERNVCFVPCGHVVACAKCALANSNCPMCRTAIECVQRVYYP